MTFLLIYLACAAASVYLVSKEFYLDGGGDFDEDALMVVILCAIIPLIGIGMGIWFAGERSAKKRAAKERS